jgi:hypothetical protein
MSPAASRSPLPPQGDSTIAVPTHILEPLEEFVHQQELSLGQGAEDLLIEKKI